MKIKGILTNVVGKDLGSTCRNFDITRGDIVEIELAQPSPYYLIPDNAEVLVRMSKSDAYDTNVYKNIVVVIEEELIEQDPMENPEIYIGDNADNADKDYVNESEGSQGTPVEKGTDTLRGELVGYCSTCFYSLHQEHANADDLLPCHRCGLDRKVWRSKEIEVGDYCEQISTDWSRTSKFCTVVSIDNDGIGHIHDGESIGRSASVLDFKLVSKGIKKEDRNCTNCRSQYQSLFEEPCDSCDGTSEWQPQHK